MKKIFAWIGIVAMLVSLMSIYTFSAAAAANYDYKIVEKSPNPTVNHGEEIVLWANLKNTGTQTWYSDRVNEYDPCYTDEFGNQYCTGVLAEPTRLGTIRPTDRNSGFYTRDNWIATNRTHLMDGTEVRPGSTGSFGFYITVPRDMQPGVYTECFAPVVENVTWMADRGLCWDINVVGQPEYFYYAATIDESNNDSYQEFVLEPGQSQQVTFTVMNSGTSIWEKYGQYPVHLAVKNDQPGNFYNSTWLSENRPAMLREDMVYPGGLGHFDFYIEAPQLSEGYKYGDYILDNYWLVAEGKAWMDDFDYYDYNYMSLQAATIMVQDDQYEEVLETMSDAWQNIESFAYDGVLEAEEFGSTVYTVDLSGNMDWHDEDEIVENMLMDMTYEYQSYYDTPLNEMEMEIETRSRGDESYMRFYIKNLAETEMDYLEELNNKWIKIDEDSIRDMFADMGLDYDDLVDDTSQTDLIVENELTDLIDDSDLMVLTEKLGTDTYEGEVCDHYRFVMDYGLLGPEYDYTGFLGAGTAALAYDNAGEIWIGRDTHLPYRLKFDDLSYYSNTYYDIYTKDYNQRFDFVRPGEYLTLTEVMDIFEQILEDLMEGSMYAKSLVKEIF